MLSTKMLITTTITITAISIMAVSTILSALGKQIGHMGILGEK